MGWAKNRDCDICGVWIAECQCESMESQWCGSYGDDSTPTEQQQNTTKELSHTPDENLIPF